MAAPHSPIGSRRRLGAELRRLRGKTGLTLDEVAEMMTCSTSKISRLETGKGVPKVPDVRELMRIYGVASDTERDMLLRLVRDGREQGWWEQVTEGVLPERFVMDAPNRYVALETEAARVSSFELALFHGLLQTPDYTRAVLRAILKGRSAQDIERLVELRRRRQLALDDPQRELELMVVLDEAVLRRVVGSPTIMAEQLRTILRRCEQPEVTVQVLPLDFGLHRAHIGQFVVLEFPDQRVADVVYIEGHAGDTYLEGADDVRLYKDILVDVSNRAMNPSESHAMIRRYMNSHAPRSKGRR